VSGLLEHADAPTGSTAPEIAGDAAGTPAAELVAAAGTAGLAVLAAAQWPETEADGAPPPVPGFVVSAFNPLVAAVAERCLLRRTGAPAPVTAVILVSAFGDLTSAAHVAAALDAGRRVAPLLFYQSVPNAIAGHVAARWSLTGPVTCVAGVADALAIAGLLISDGDAEEALVVRVELTDTAVDVPDLAVAVLVGVKNQGD
jgi:3-oxoacyl-(acyl-carrier-protein) synthase